MLKIKKLICHKKIKVYFLVQYKAGCSKIKDVIKAMERDTNTEIKVIAFPEDINEFPKNKDLLFWKQQLGDIVIDSIQNNQWFNLKNKKPDYVFIQRPYDNYLPEEYHKKELSKYTKICYIPYGYSLADIFDVTMTREDMKYLHIIFAENIEANKYYNKLIKSIDDNKKRYSVSLGYPILDRIKKETENNGSMFKRIKGKDSLNILWTPRWTTDKNIYETSFFTYKDTLIDYCKNDKKISLVFRPHPLTFQNFIEKKLMTKKEINDYLLKFKDNLIYDDSKEYIETFKDTDVLITDFSSILPEYFLFNKPIIYTQKQNGKNKENNILKKMKKSFYLADNMRDIKNILENLKKGIDPLKEKREKIKKELFKENDGDVSNKIVQYLKNDFYGINN